MSLNKDTAPIACLVESLLASISEIIESVVCIGLAQEEFFEIGCYIYRASPAIMELHTTKYTPENAMEVLQSLAKSINLAKNLLRNCLEHPTSDPELRSVVEQLRGVIKDMGQCLSLIPSSTFTGEEYAEVAVRSLSNELKNVQFENRKIQVLQAESLLPKVPVAVERLKEEKAVTESDLYSVNVEVSMENPQFLDMPQLVEILRSTSQSSQMKHKNRNSSMASLPQVAQYIEPLYETFFCPLTKEIMDDPVTIESGVTYEKKAISEWFRKFGNSKEVICPTTGMKLLSRNLSTNIALKTTIEEWKERNEATRIKIARAALSVAGSENMVLEAINDLLSVCRRTRYNRVQVRNAGVLPLLATFLEYKDRNVRCEALELLRLLAEDDEDGKEMIVRILDLSIIIKMLSSSHQAVRHAALLFLLELSRSQSLCEKIGSVPGGILMLISIKYNHRSTDSFASVKADEILRNLETSSKNIKIMAESGLFEPLVNHLTEGSEETQIEMASYLGEIILGHDSQTYVAQRASPVLLTLVQSGNAIARRAAFRALSQISSYHPNSKILAEAGIVQVMAEEMFARKIHSELMDSKNEAAAILANVLDSGLECERLQVNTHGHTMSSDYVVYNIIYMLRNSNPDELNVSLIRILLCLTKSPKSTASIVSVVKETEASYALIELINNPHEEVGVAAIKLLIALAPYMGHTLCERLCKTRGQPENLIQSPTETNRITEKQAVSVNLLAKLPHQNLTLNLALFGRNVVPKILESINLIQRSGMRTSRHAKCYLEGLVGILVRFTTTLYEPQMLFLAIDNNFTSVFTELLMKTSSNEVQRLSAIGLENLSSQSVNLSKAPQIKKTKFKKLFSLPKCFSFDSSKSKKIAVCPVHRGVCSSQNTFCLIDAKAVERLLGCLDHENVEVVEAALSAICTLLDDKVDVDKSINMLSQVNAIQQVLKVVKEHRQEGLWQKSFWMIDRFLVKGGDESVSDISQDRLLPATLVSAFHHGDGNTRQMAEKILRHLNKMPNFNTYNYITM